MGPASAGHGRPPLACLVVIIISLVAWAACAPLSTGTGCRGDGCSAHGLVGAGSERSLRGRDGSCAVGVIFPPEPELELDERMSRQLRTRRNRRPRRRRRRREQKLSRQRWEERRQQRQRSRARREWLLRQRGYKGVAAAGYGGGDDDYLYGGYGAGYLDGDYNGYLYGGGYGGG